MTSSSPLPPPLHSRLYDNDTSDASQPEVLPLSSIQTSQQSQTPYAYNPHQPTRTYTVPLTPGPQNQNQHMRPSDIEDGHHVGVGVGVGARRFPFAIPKVPRGPVARSYAADWILTIVLWIAFYLLDKVDGYRREFSLNDISIQHTFATSERVPVWLLGLIAVLFPLLTIVLYTFLAHTLRRRFSHSPSHSRSSSLDSSTSALSAAAWDIHCGLLGLLLSLALATSITQIIKITAGRPRPDLIDRCQPRDGATDAPVYGLSNSSICTTDNVSRLRDGFRSFPSGHSSTAFAGLGYLFLFLSGKLHLFDRRGHQIKAWIVLTPLMAATLVAVSRTMDNRHHYQDVSIGSLLGYLTAWFAYRLYYPPLGDVKSHCPYDVRGRQGADREGLGRATGRGDGAGVRGEEERGLYDEGEDDEGVEGSKGYAYAPASRGGGGEGGDGRRHVRAESSQPLVPTMGRQ